MEDFGAEEKMALDFGAAETGPDASNLGLSDMMGAGWISKDHPPEPTTKIAIAVRQDGPDPWVFAAGKAADVFGGDGSSWSTSQVLLYLEKVGMESSFPTGTIIFPLVCPMRMVTADGVVFIG